MNLKISSLLFFLLFAFSVQGQKRTNVAVYFDKDWKVTTDTTTAQFYRTIDEVNGTYIVKDFFWTDTLQMIGECTSVHPKMIFDGKAKWYFSNGRIKKEAFFEKNNPSGVMKTYYENGAPHSFQIYRGEKNLFCQYWKSDGIPLLVKGTGIVVEENPDFMEPSHRVVVDSTVVASYSISSTNQDTVYIVCDKIPEYKGGQKKFYDGLNKDLKYPPEARRFGIEGVAFVQFVITEKGKATNFTVLKGLGYGCDKAAVDAVSMQNDWNPAKYKGRSVKFRMVVPMSFRLK